jgi:hypothetical protein
MADSTTFSTRSNARRAAEKAIRDGTAPSIDYGLRSHRDGRFEIVWKDRAKEARDRLGMPSTTDDVEAEIATATAESTTSPNDYDGSQFKQDLIRQRSEEYRESLKSADAQAEFAETPEAQADTPPSNPFCRCRASADAGRARRG